LFLLHPQNKILYQHLVSQRYYPFSIIISMLRSTKNLIVFTHPSSIIILVIWTNINYFLNVAKQLTRVTEIQILYSRFLLSNLLLTFPNLFTPSSLIFIVSDYLILGNNNYG
jgi:hypothetical protein